MFAISVIFFIFLFLRLFCVVGSQKKQSTTRREVASDRRLSLFSPSVSDTKQNVSSSSQPSSPEKVRYTLFFIEIYWFCTKTPYRLWQAPKGQVREYIFFAKGPNLLKHFTPRMNTTHAQVIRFRIRHCQVGHQQKVGIWPPYRYEGFLTGFYKGTFRAQTGTIVHSRTFLVLFRSYK